MAFEDKIKAMAEARQARDAEEAQARQNREDEYLAQQRLWGAEINSSVLPKFYEMADFLNKQGFESDVSTSNYVNGGANGLPAGAKLSIRTRGPRPFKAELELIQNAGAEGGRYVARSPLEINPEGGVVKNEELTPEWIEEKVLPLIDKLYKLK